MADVPRWLTTTAADSSCKLVLHARIIYLLNANQDLVGNVDLQPGTNLLYGQFMRWHRTCSIEKFRLVYAFDVCNYIGYKTCACLTDLRVYKYSDNNNKI
jgi:hypothetical protein